VFVDVSTKPFEIVFDSIISGPREPTTDALAIEAAEIDDADEIEVIDADIEINAYEIDAIDAGYTDAPMTTGSGTATPGQDQIQPDEYTAATIEPLGMTGPVGSGLMSLSDAVEAQAEMNRRANLRDERRR
jgi:hypothetical protein